MKIKGFAWVGVGSHDFDRSLDFFTQVLGLPVTNNGGGAVHLKVGDRQELEIFSPDHPRHALHQTPTVAFEVEDFEAARDELISAGVELVGEPGEWNGFAWQYFRSPDGHLFELKRLPPEQRAN